jgi:hypothetical protein
MEFNGQKIIDKSGKLLPGNPLEGAIGHLQQTSEDNVYYPCEWMNSHLFVLSISLICHGDQDIIYWQVSKIALSNGFCCLLSGFRLIWIPDG